MKKKMSEPNREYMQRVIDKEGFCYAFVDYSNFDEVDDPIFHELRAKFLQIHQEFNEYMGIDS